MWILWLERFLQLEWRFICFQSIISKSNGREKWDNVKTKIFGEYNYTNLCPGLSTSIIFCLIQVLHILAGSYYFIFDRIVFGWVSFKHSILDIPAQLKYGINKT